MKPTNYARGVLQSLNIEFQCMVPYGTQKSMIILDLMSNTKPGFWRVILRAVGLWQSTLSTLGPSDVNFWWSRDLRSLKGRNHQLEPGFSSVDKNHRMQDQRMAVPSAFYSSCQSIYRNQWCPAPSKKNLRLQNHWPPRFYWFHLLVSCDFFGKNNKNCGFPPFPQVSLMDFPGCSYPVANRAIPTGIRWRPRWRRRRFSKSPVPRQAPTWRPEFHWGRMF